MGPLPSTSTRGPASARHTVDYRGVYSRGTFEVTCYFCLPRNTLRAKDWAESTLLFVDMAASSATSAPLAPMCCPNCLQEFRATTGDINLTPQLFVVCGHHTCRLCAEMRALTAQCCPICASPSSYILDSALAEYSEFVWGQLHALKSVGCQDCAALVQDEEPDAATCECVECHRILCSLHAESHESLFKRRGKIDHSCAALPGRRPPSSGLCSEHRQAFSYFCFTHLAPLCSTCVLHDHGGMAATSGTAPPASAPVCNVRELTSSSDELRLRVGHAMHMCTVKASNLEEGAAGLFRMKTHMQQRETKSCDLVVAAVDRAIAALQAHKAAVVREMRQRVAAAEKVIDGQIDEVRTSATVLTAARTMASEALRSGNVTLIASAYEFGGRTAVAVKPFVGSRQTVGVHLCVDDGPVLAATAALGKVEEYPLLMKADTSGPAFRKTSVCRESIKLKLLSKNAGMCVGGPEDELAVSNHAACTVTFFSAKDLTFRRVIGRPGSSEGEFLRPRRLCFTSCNTLLVAEWDNKRVQEVRMDGSHARFFPTGSWAEAVAVHSSLLAVGVCGTPSCSVMLFDYMTGTLLSKVTHPELSSRCSSLSLSWDGSVVFAVSTGAVLLFNTEDGTHVRTLNVQDELGDVVDALPTGRDELVLLTRNEGLYVMSLNDSTFGLLTHVRDSPARQKVKKQRKAVSWSGGLARQRGKLFVLDRNRVRCWY